MVNEAEKPGQTDRFDSIRDLHGLLLEAASAIQRIGSERDELRLRVETLESEAASLRERTTLTLDSYRRLTAEYVKQLKILDTGANELLPEPDRLEDQEETASARVSTVATGLAE